MYTTDPTTCECSGTGYAPAISDHGEIVQPGEECPYHGRGFGRDAAIRQIRAALKRRSGRAWSVTGGRGTAWGWITIDAPPARRTWRERPKADNPNGEPGIERWEPYDAGEPGHYMSPTDRAELALLLDLDSVHCQGVSIAASRDYYREYIDRAEGRTPLKIAAPYWD